MDVHALPWPQLLGLYGIAFGLSLLGSLAAERLALKVGLVDQPAHRKLHRRPTPLLGGAALFAAIGATMASFTLTAANVVPGLAGGGVVSGAGLLAAAVGVFALGLWDDSQRLPVTVKAPAQLVVVALALAAGAVIDTALPGWADLMLSGWWIFGVMNTLNLLDNMDGVAAGVAAVAALGLLVLLPAGWPVALAVVLGGACLGFLCLNFSPARLFMGDSGSLLLGLLLAVLAIEAQRGASDSLVSWVAPVVVLAVPLFDTTLVVVSRLRRGLNPMTHSGTDHLAHRLLRLGWPVAGAARLLYTVAAAMALIGVALGRSGGVGIHGVLIVAVIGAGLSIWWLDRRPQLITGAVDPSGGRRL
nr:probable undecaprenyl-phosphate N-acetylglucosaminyl 1-phosphate transferase [Nerophis lumbriciformis]